MMAKFKQTSDEKMSDLKRVTEGKRGGYTRSRNNQQK
jgi:S1 RNA binding domain protein